MKHTWYKVKIWLNGIQEPLDISMTKKEIDELKKRKKEGIEFYFETDHPQSNRLLIDITEIVAISEIKEYGDD